MLSTDGYRVEPRFLGPGDHPWIAVLLRAFTGSVGHRRADLEQNLRDAALIAAPERLGTIARAVLLDLARSEVKSLLSPKEVRAAVFRGSWAEAAAQLGASVPALEASLFADLPPERIVVDAPPIDSAELALRANLSVAQSLLARSTEVRLTVEGQARAIVRQARLGGLIASVEGDGARAVLSLSGPLAICRRTLVYGRALAALVPALAWCDRFRLEAELVLRAGARRLVLSSPAPIFPSAPPRAFDSKLEARFAKDFAKAAPEWELIREPEAVRAGRHLVFPDFLVRHRLNPTRQILIEIVGFWTPDYLARKTAAIRAMTVPLLVCVDAELGVGEGELPSGVEVVAFRRRLRAEEVLARIEAATAQARAAAPRD